MKKYKTGRMSWGVESKIEEVEVEKETDASVWVGGNRLAKATDWHRFHETWEDAHAYLLTEADRQVQNARRDLETAKSRFGNVKGMKKPAGA